MHNDFPKLSNPINIESSSISFSKKTNRIHLTITRLVLNQNHLHFFKLMTLSLLTGGEWCHFLQRCFYLNTKPPSMNATFTSIAFKLLLSLPMLTLYYDSPSPNPSGLKKTTNIPWHWVTSGTFPIGTFPLCYLPPNLLAFFIMTFSQRTFSRPGMTSIVTSSS